MSGFILNNFVKGSGLVAEHIQGGATIAAYSVVYINAAGQWAAADADLAATMPVVGLATEPLRVNQKGRVLLQGFAASNTWTWVPGGVIYASATVGALTQTKPAGAGDIVQVVGYAVSATLIYFDAKLDGDMLSITDYEIVTGEIAEPTIASKGNGHNVVVEYSDFTPNRMMLWKRGTGDTVWFGVEML